MIASAAIPPRPPDTYHRRMSSDSPTGGAASRYGLLLATAVICLIPPLLNVLGFDFGSQRRFLDPGKWLTAEPVRQEEAFFIILTGPLVHTLIEWTAVCVAVLTAIVSFVHYSLKRDITTPVIGTALLFVGLFDAFRILLVDRLPLLIQDPDTFTRITWAVSRSFHILIVFLGTLPFLFGDVRQHRPRSDLRDYALLTLLFAVGSVTMMTYFANMAPPDAESPATTLRPDFLMNIAALVLYLVAGGSVLMRYQRKHPSLFARSLQASIIPHVFAQIAILMLSERLYDNGFHLASLYKLIGYALPLVGLMLDYRRASRADAELKTTERQLDIARQISESLLPDGPPAIDGWDAAGFSRSSEAVGGDYFDYIPLPDGTWLVIIADVSGHDLGAALLTADARSYLKALAESETDVGFLASKLNGLVGRSARQRRFITSFLVRVRPGEATVRYVDAGHTGYVVEPDGQLRPLSQRNVPLGIADELSEGPSETPVGERETLLLVTDGMHETLSPSGQQFGMQRLASVIGRTADEPAEATLRAIRDELESWAAGAAPTDDQTIVLLKRR